MTARCIWLVSQFVTWPGRRPLFRRISIWGGGGGGGMDEVTATAVSCSCVSYWPLTKSIAMLCLATHDRADKLKQVRFTYPLANRQK